MAGTRISLDSEQVLAIASTIESDNQQLQQLLQQSKTTLDELSNIWTGEAAETTRASYTEFSGKFFQKYYEILDQYVQFLRRNVAEQYTEVEQTNVKLADAFK